MNEVKQLELLSESIKNEIDELQSLLENSDNVLLKAKKQEFQKQLSNIVSNLNLTNDSLYCAFETLNAINTEKLKENYYVLHDILGNKLSYDEKIDIRIKHGIEFY